MNKDIVKLFEKYLDNQCSSEEVETVLSLIAAGTYLKEWDFVLSEDARRLLEDEDKIPVQNELSKIDLHHRLMNSVNAHEKSRRLKIFRLKRTGVSIVAAASVLLFFGWWFFAEQSNWNHGKDNQIAYESDIAPGKFGAKLRLSNGDVVNLDGSKTGLVIKDEQLSYNDGTQLELSAKPLAGKTYTAFTDNGNMYTLTLSDGTQVWLNAGSQLDFPANFAGQRRQVRLTGEAFFKVAEDKFHPFIVESKGQQVKVLGTEFNISSYPDEQATKTTLVAGSIQISSADNGFLLKPGQQATLDAKGSLAVSPVDTTLATAWKNNKFIFENDDIESIMRMVKRWYNVEVIYVGPLPDVTFGGKVSRFNHVSGVLRVLETTGGVHFKTQGNKIYVSK